MTTRTARKPTKRTVKKTTARKAPSSNGLLPVVFEEPPPPTTGSRRKSKFIPLLQAARENPGKSIKISSTNTSVATNIRNGKYAGVEKGEFDVVTRTAAKVDGKARVDVYVKYRGKKNGR